MIHIFGARVDWICQEKGFERPPEGTKVFSLIDIADDKAWSIMFVCPDFDKTDLIDFIVVAELLDKTAPLDLIKEKCKYEINLCGRRLANIHILNKRYENERPDWSYLT